MLRRGKSLTPLCSSVKAFIQIKHFYFPKVPDQVFCRFRIMPREGNCIEGEKVFLNFGEKRNKCQYE